MGETEKSLKEAVANAIVEMEPLKTFGYKTKMRYDNKYDVVWIKIYKIAKGKGLLWHLGSLLSLRLQAHGLKIIYMRGCPDGQIEFAIDRQNTHRLTIL